MLCLNRKTGERIRIGPDIEVCIVQVREGRVIVGIEAPENVSVLRDDAIKQEKPKAA